MGKEWYGRCLPILFCFNDHFDMESNNSACFVLQGCPQGDQIRVPTFSLKIKTLLACPDFFFFLAHQIIYFGGEADGLKIEIVSPCTYMEMMHDP